MDLVLVLTFITQVIIQVQQLQVSMLQKLIQDFLMILLMKLQVNGITMLKTGHCNSIISFGIQQGFYIITVVLLTMHLAS